MLLRVLQEGEIRPVGSLTTSRIDVRLLAATNKDLRVAIERGEFRADLYDRLAEFFVAVPPLRERVDDIAWLAQEVVRRQTSRHRLTCRGLSAEALAVLGGDGWRGNGRGMERTLGREGMSSEGG